MPLQSRGFEVTNIPKAQGIDFSLQPGQFVAGLNSGIGAFNAFNNIAEEVRDRPLRNRERESRLAQIESEAVLAPIRRQLTEIQLAKAGLPEEIVTSSTAIRVPRADAPDQYDITEQLEGFTFDPTTQQRVPFKRAGKLLTSAEEISNRQAIRSAELDRIAASKANYLAEAAARTEANNIKQDALNLRKKQFEDTVARADAEAKAKGYNKTVGLDADGFEVVMYTNPNTGEAFSLGGDLKLKPIQREAAPPFFGLSSGIGKDAPPKPAPAAPPKPASVVDEVLGQLPNEGEGVLPVIPITTSKGYKIIQRN